MELARLNADASKASIVSAIQRDGAAIVERFIDDAIADQVRNDLRAPFDEVGRDSESELNGYKTLRVNSVSEISDASVGIVGHHAMLDVIDALLLPHCETYRLGSSMAVEIFPGETAQQLHTDDSIYPVRPPGIELQISVMWALDDFTVENGATRVVPYSHLWPATKCAPDDGDEVVSAPMPKGSALFYLGSIGRPAIVRLKHHTVATRGLTLGKYAPLHKGHQLVIETAIEEMDEVIVLVYDAPEATGVPLHVRAGWLRRLYPSIEVIEVRGAPSEVGYTPALMKSHEQCILKTLNGTPISCFYASEAYGEHVSRALNARNREVERHRGRYPVSGTEVRKNLFAARRYLHPIVYRDLVTNVVFLGAPSTGKTTLARQMAETLRTQWMPEHGRAYWHAHQVERRLTLAQLSELAQRHLRQEELRRRASERYLFTDTNAITTAVFSHYYHGVVEPDLMKLCEECRERYDLVFVCDTDIPYEDTPDRSGAANRDELQSRTFDMLGTLGIAFRLLTGSLPERMRVVEHSLRQFDKWSPARLSTRGDSAHRLVASR